MLRNRQPTYEVTFLERQGPKSGFERRWVSAAVNGFDENSSRHEQVERILSALGKPVIEGDFKMRRMRGDEVKDLRKKNKHSGGTHISHTKRVDGLTANITYPEGDDLKRVREERKEMAASWMGCIEAVKEGTVIGFAAFRSGLGMVTREDADSLEAELRAQLGPLYVNDQPASSAENAAVA